MKNQYKKDIPDDFMRDEYNFDYSKGVRGKYSGEAIDANEYDKLNSYFQEIINGLEEVNKALKAISSAIPKKGKHHKQHNT